jgi:hypothetical protein
MRPRTELAIAVAASAVLVALAFTGGVRVRSDDDLDLRASSFNAGREGARALADVAERLGMTVTRWRARPQRLAAWIGALGDTTAGEVTVVVLGPAAAIAREERAAFLGLTTQRRGAGLVLAGREVGALVDCLGYRIVPSFLDSSRVGAPATNVDSSAPFAHDYFAPGPPDWSGDEDEGEDVGFAGQRTHACPTLIVEAADTLLVNARGHAVMLQLTMAPHGRAVVLLSDAALVRNRSLRTGATVTATAILEAVLPREGHVVFDEFHQGYAEGGSMAAVVLDWSRRNPLGWMVWQWVAVGLIALLAGAFRFGPVRASIRRDRRSSLEHVRALATALAASHGHRTAVGAMVRGLRRRLAPGHAAAPRTGDDWRQYLADLRAHAPNPQVQANAAQLERLADHPESDTAVLRAANAVEDLWHSLRP